MRAAPPLFLLSLLFLAGCATLDEMRVRDAPAEGTPSWRLGYADGCQSGRQAARAQHPENRVLDRDRFRTDDEYRQGWQEGHDECLARTRDEEAAAASTADSPAAPAANAPAAAPAATAPPPSERRAEIQRRITELRGEIDALERELEELPD